MKAKEKKATAYLRRYAANIEILYRTEIFLAVFSFALAVVYSVGAAQSFMDSTLVMLLDLLSTTSLADIFLAIIVVIREVFALFSKRRKARIFVIASSIFFLIFSAILLFFSHILVAVSEGF